MSKNLVNVIIMVSTIVILAIVGIFLQLSDTPITGATSQTICGNGLIENSESCDDGNTLYNDGCSSTCEIESDYSCSGEPSICTN